MTTKRVQFEFGFACDLGRKRKGEPNQDTVEVVLPTKGERWHPPLLLVADGLGRYFGGAVASQTVVKAFKQEFKQAQHPTDYPRLMEQCVQAAHQAIRAQGTQDEKLTFMGSTIVAVTLEAERLFVLNVGDSRAYILRDKKLLQVSEDQSWIAAQVRAGILTEDEIRTHPDRSRLTMAITAKRTEVEAVITEVRLELRDVVLLCSDGLWSIVPETLIRAAATELAPQIAADKLVTLANNNQGPDNISVIIARRANLERKNTTMSLDDTHP